MKKLLLVLSLILTFSFVNVKAEELPEVVEGKDKVIVHMFRGEGCSGCYYAIEEINQIIKKYEDYLVINTYEIYNNDANMSASNYFVDMFDGENSIPFFVIGDDFAQNGYSEDVIDAALKAYEEENINDVVLDYMSDNEDIKMTDLKEASEEEGIKYLGTDAEASNDTIVILVIFAVVIGGLAFLIFAPRKK